MISLSLVLPVIFLCAVLLTALVLRYAVANDIIDVPNGRSSHVASTPRGGGLAIIISFFLGLSVCWFVDPGNDSLYIALFGSGSLVAIVGFQDDLGHIPPSWRLVSHFAAALWCVYWLSFGHSQQLIEYEGIPEWLYICTVIVALVWLLNLYNFMDGIDGLAASETLFITVGGAYFSMGANIDVLSSVFLLLTVSTLGFLVWNWPPAKIFMGDVGSGFLGVTLGVLVFVSVVNGIISVWVWLILLSVFVIDATLTLGRRILKGECWYEAHANHAYQVVSRKWGHQKVVIAVGLINIFWLFPLAIIADYKSEWQELVMLITYLSGIYVWFVIGKKKF